MSQSVHKFNALQLFQGCLGSLTGLAVQRAMRAEIVLGMPKHDCRFHGICRVEAPGAGSAFAGKPCYGETVVGWLLRPEPNYCILLIEKGSLAEDREFYHFARACMEVSQPLDVSGFYPEHRGKKYLLRSGEYPMQSARDYYAIRLPVCTRYEKSIHIL